MITIYYSKIVIVSILYILLLITPIHSFAQSLNDLTVYVWDFRTNDEQGDQDLAYKLTQEFEEKLIQTGCFTVIDRRNRDAIGAHQQLEKEIRGVEEFSLEDQEFFAELKADAVIFGEFFDDIRSGQFKIAIVFETFRGEKRASESIKFSRGKIFDAESRESVLQELVEKLCVSNKTLSTSKELANVQVRWELVTERSSLSYEKNGQDMKIFPNHRLSWNSQNGDGSPENDPQYHHRILQWLRNRCETQSLTKYLPYLLREDTNLIEITFSKPKLIWALMPTLAEYNSLNSEEQDIVNKWLVRYVGQWNPRIRITIDNTIGTTNIQVISLVYDVEDISAFASNIPFPKFQEYSFELAYKTGIQEFPLSPQDGEVAVPIGRSSTFDIVFHASEEAGISPIWDGIVSLNTNRGNIKIGRLHLMTYNPYKEGIKGKLTGESE